MKISSFTFRLSLSYILFFLGIFSLFPFQFIREFILLFVLHLTFICIGNVQRAQSLHL
jgi:hypothetical protein